MLAVSSNTLYFDLEKIYVELRKVNFSNTSFKVLRTQTSGFRNNVSLYEFLSVFGPKASAKALEPILFTFSKDLCFRLKQIHE